MSGSIFESMRPNNPYENMAAQIREFKKTITGDPKQIVEGMLASGQLPQAEFNRYAQMAQQIMPFVSGKI